MATDTVTPETTWFDELQARGRSLGDPTLEAWALIQRLFHVGEGLITDESWPGFRTSDETRTEMTRAVTLLEEVAQLVERCIAREAPLAEPYYQAFNAEEQRQFAAAKAAKQQSV